MKNLLGILILLPTIVSANFLPDVVVVRPEILEVKAYYVPGAQQLILYHTMDNGSKAGLRAAKDIVEMLQTSEELKKPQISSSNIDVLAKEMVDAETKTLYCDGEYEVQTNQSNRLSRIAVRRISVCIEEDGKKFVHSIGFNPILSDKVVAERVKFIKNKLDQRKPATVVNDTNKGEKARVDDSDGGVFVKRVKASDK